MHFTYTGLIIITIIIIIKIIMIMVIIIRWSSLKKKKEVIITNNTQFDTSNISPIFAKHLCHLIAYRSITAIFIRTGFTCARILGENIF